jgi:hypothetical protein
MMKPILGYQGYFITEDGKVFCNLGKGNRNTDRTKPLYEVRGRPTPHGYLRISARNRDTHRRCELYIHRLVGEYFLPPAADGARCINHKNCDRTDNRVENLEWCTPKENTAQTFRLRHMLRNVAGKFVGNYNHLTGEMPLP